MLRVEIRWIDSGTAHENGWESQDAILRAAKLHEISSVGWLMHEDEDAYYLCTSWDEASGHYFGTQVIARPAVLSVARLRTRKFSASEENDQG